MFQFVAPLSGADQGAYQLNAEDGQRDAWYDFDDDAVRPKVGILQKTAVGLGQVAIADCVESDITCCVGWVRPARGLVGLFDSEWKKLRQTENRRTDIGYQNGYQGSIQSAPLSAIEGIGYR